jgi:hypothetical protein
LLGDELVADHLVREDCCLPGPDNAC